MFMHELKLVRLLEKMPVFSLADVSKITGRSYAKKLLSRLVSKGTVKRILRDKYSFHSDPLIVAPFLSFPSYISCASALSFHGLISQTPNSVFLMTLKRPKIINYSIPLIYHKTKYFFGYSLTKINSLMIPIAEPEKAFIDSIGIHPLHIVLEALPELNHEKLLFFAKKCSETKRIGFLLEKNGFNVKKPAKLSSKYIYLDPLCKKKGLRDKKWKLIVNF